jgi:uracil-DNA glycosylase family 4
MDRREAVLRELNLHPRWVRRNQPAPVPAQQDIPAKQDVPAAAEKPVPEAIPVAAGQAIPVPLQTETTEITAPHVAAPASLTGNFNWPQLREAVRNCTACRLRAGCTQTVFGVGDEKAGWLFVGEGPGADEDAQGEPFVGQAGKLLDNMLMAIKLKRGKNVYIANIVKCRPPDNRTPAADEIAACLPYLERQIELMQPKMIVALGKVASNALLGRDATLASLRGKLHDYRGIPLLVTYHPAYLLRTPSEKAKAWQDLCMAVKAMEDKVA